MLRAGGTKKVSPPLTRGRERDSHRGENANFQGGAERLFTGIRGRGGHGGGGERGGGKIPGTEIKRKELLAVKLYLKTTSDVKCLSKDMDQNLGWYLSLSAEHFFLRCLWFSAA